jgi:hypothetical protein
MALECKYSRELIIGCKIVKSVCWFNVICLFCSVLILLWRIGVDALTQCYNKSNCSSLVTKDLIQSFNWCHVISHLNREQIKLQDPCDGSYKIKPSETKRYSITVLLYQNNAEEPLLPLSGLPVYKAT